MVEVPFPSMKEDPQTGLALYCAVKAKDSQHQGPNSSFVPGSTLHSIGVLLRSCLRVWLRGCPSALRTPGVGCWVLVMFRRPPGSRIS